MYIHMIASPTHCRDPRQTERSSFSDDTDALQGLESRILRRVQGARGPDLRSGNVQVPCRQQHRQHRLLPQPAVPLQGARRLHSPS